MENILKTRTKFTPGVVEGDIDGKPFSVKADNLIHALLEEVNPPFTVYRIVMNIIIIYN